VFENSVLRRISGSNADEVTRGWKKLHMPNKELQNLHSSQDIRKIRWAGKVACMRIWEMRTKFMVLNARKRPLRTQRRR
jgi:hypothetical protein